MIQLFASHIGSSTGTKRYTKLNAEVDFCYWYPFAIKKLNGVYGGEILQFLAIFCLK
jgi:hypothetical protein